MGRIKAKQKKKNQLCILRYFTHVELISEFLQCQSLFTLMNTVSWVQTGVIGHPRRKLNDQWLPQLSVPFYSNWNKTKNKKSGGALHQDPQRSSSAGREEAGTSCERTIQMGSSHVPFKGQLVDWTLRWALLPLKALAEGLCMHNPQGQSPAGISGVLHPTTRSMHHCSGREGQAVLHSTRLPDTAHWLNPIVRGHTHEHGRI